MKGESEQSRLAAPTRGLAAVLLFYEGRQCLVNSLRALIQAREGRCWTLGLSKVVSDLITKFTNDLWDADLCNQIFSERFKSSVEPLSRVVFFILKILHNKINLIKTHARFLSCVLIL